ncbi:hypothetical protein PMZ80_006495 [Knufia obscura]|uniref:Uncharacterized protein n=1 Tax=Knufia obscura TaxID=1635080 RepID=A0ABR0RKT9_9EURO|nr:hypothetical protein PMZ80_006495 [Knufia obscura]
MSIVYLPTDRAPGSRTSSHQQHPTPLPPYSARPSTHHSHATSHASPRRPSHHSQASSHASSQRSSSTQHSYPHPPQSSHTRAPSHHPTTHSQPQFGPPITGPILSGPPTNLCTCTIDPNDPSHQSNRATALHLAKHMIDIVPYDADRVHQKLDAINTLRSRGINCTNVGSPHWGPLTIQPNPYATPDMAGWTVRAQLNYYLKSFSDSLADPTSTRPQERSREGQEIFTIMARCVETLGCMDCRHNFGLGANGGNPAEMNACWREMERCHERRTGHEYAGGCCGNGAYLVEGEMSVVGNSRPRERFVLEEGSRSGVGSRSGRSQATDRGTIYLPGSYVPESRGGSARSGSRRESHAGRSQQSGASRQSGTSGRSKYDRSEASGWIKPSARSERGVPGSVAASGRSEGNTTSIMPGESYGGYGERQGERRRDGKKKH